MGWILQRLLGRRTTPVACYLRENGPIAYELDLFTASARERAEVMLSVPLSWAWKSGTREWTHLSRISLSAFLADLPNGVLLVASEEELPTGTTDAEVADWMRRFSRLQPGPLAAIVSTAGGRQLLFVQQHATDAVNELLAEWGIDKRAAVRKSYARLGTASLETIAEQF